MRTRLSDVICANTHIEELQGNVFLLSNPANPLIKCNDPQRPKLNLARLIDNALQGYQAYNDKLGPK